LHLAQLDIRQNSRMHDEAIAQLLVAAGIDGATYPDWNEDKRLSLLNEELLVGRPFTLEDISAGNQADVVLGALRVAANYRKQFGGASRDPAWGPPRRGVGGYPWCGTWFPPARSGVSKRFGSAAASVRLAHPG
jgi:hypothetical protein